MKYPLKRINAILKAIREHPLAGKHLITAYGKFLLWQLGCLITNKPRKVPFTKKTFLVATKGMAGATGNIYMGLHEFNDMGFLLHFLRKEDSFFDIGANVGSYTVLASGHVGVVSHSFEPVPATFRALERNIKENGIEDIVHAHNIGVGAESGELYFTSEHDSINHVIKEGEQAVSSGAVKVAIRTVDDVIKQYKHEPVLIKIDVEGFETEVLNGMDKTLINQQLKAIIIELNGSGQRYNYDEDAIHQKLVSAGFLPFDYDPFKRSFSSLATYGKFNTLYLRDIHFIRERVSAANKVVLFSEKF